MNQDIKILNDQFGIDSELEFIDRGNGFIVAEISNQHCSATIALNGAHLLSWTPAGEQPVIWLSEDVRLENGKSIRGGIPVCWPWFGAHGSENSFPAHGFARTSVWQVLAAETLCDGNTLISFRLSRATHPLMWPFPTSCEITFHIGKSLDIELTTTNHSEECMMITQALHTYFATGDIRRATVEGLDGCDYLDKPDGFKRKQQTGPVSFDGEVDRVYLDTAADCLIRDPVLDRTIRIQKQGSHSTIVWNPWDERAAEMGDLGHEGYQTMLCVESANAATDIITIASGQSCTLSASYTLLHPT